MNRRTFMKQAALAAGAATFLGPKLTPRLLGRETSPAATMLVGTPVMPEDLVEQGIATSLDRMKEMAGINTVLVFTHRHVAHQYRRDYGPARDKDGRELTSVWVRTDPRYYDDPSLQGKNFSAKYADFDILDALREEASPRGMRVYARILEPYVITGAIRGMETWREVNALGDTTDHVCLNHPQYIRYWESVADDLVRSHPYLEGFKSGQERGGPLLAALGKGAPGKCFCNHCRKLAAARGLDVENARQGLLAVHDYGERLRAGEELYDGNFVGLLRLLIRYPALLPWEQFWMDSREEQRKRLYHQIKAINPACQVGWHLDHGLTWDLIGRATSDYSQLGGHSDWLSVAVYFDSMGRRSLGHYERNYQDLIFGDAKPELSYPFYLSLLGYDPSLQPTLEQHREKDTAFHPEYVYKECRRVVQNVRGGAQVHARIGFDMPRYNAAVTPGDIHSAVAAAFKAGVDGFWVGREWAELKPENVRAFGQALQKHS